MTLDRCVERLREVRALERTRAALALHATDPDWRYTLTMIGDRLFWLRGCLTVEDPQLIGDALDVLDAERRTETREPVRPDCQVAVTAHVSRRIH